MIGHLVVLYRTFFTFILLGICLHTEQLQAKPVSAKSWVVSDITGRIIHEEQIDAVRPIASITKLITAMIVLDAGQDLDEMLPLSSRLKNRLPNKEKYTRRTLLEISLVNSDNRASMTLCEHYPGGYDACIRALNVKVQELGMSNTLLTDPTGLDHRNLSTARDLVFLVRAARTYGMIIDSSRKNQVKVRTIKRWIHFVNTNPMIGRKQNVLVSKTGWTIPAGGCIVLLLDTDLGDRIVVILGSRNTHTRIPEAEFISALPDNR